MRIGAVFPQTEIGADPSVIRDYAQAVEQMGFAHIVVYDHVLGANTARSTLILHGGVPVDYASIGAAFADAMPDELAAFMSGQVSSEQGDHRRSILKNLKEVEEALEPDSSQVNPRPRKAHAAGDSNTGLVEELVESSSGVNLDDETPVERASGRDLIAEGVEWGAGQGGARPAAADEAESILEGEGERNALDDGSSAVDLGSSAVIEVDFDINVVVIGIQVVDSLDYRDLDPRKRGKISPSKFRRSEHDMLACMLRQCLGAEQRA